MGYRDLVDQILSLPSAPAIVEEVGQVLAEEKKRRQEFYNKISEYEKAEFINGEVVIHSPVKKEHNDVSTNLFQLINPFVKLRKLGYVGFEKVMISLARNDYEPDICFFSQEKAQHFKKGQSLFPAPDLVVEILSKKTAKNDRGVKFEDYQSHGVLEYWIIDPKGETVEQYRMNEAGKYELILKAGQGPISCQAIQGFEIGIEAIFDEVENMKELNRLLSL